MMLRAVARIVLPLIFAATLCLPGVGQNTSPYDQTGNSTPAAEPAPAAGAATLGSSTSLNSDSNDVASLYGTSVEEIVARVNDRVITNSDLKRAQDQLAEQSRQGTLTLDQYNAAEKNLLRDLIDQQLLLSKGKQLGITGDTELIKRLDEIRKQNHLGSLDDLEKAVEQSGTSYEDFKANIRNSIVTQDVVRQEVGSKMQISQADIQKYYDEHLDSFALPESVHLNEILIPTEENATPDQLNAADAKANEVESKLKSGGSFAQLSREYSGGPTAKQGGDLGDFKRGALAKVLEDQTFSLPVGGYTGPIRTRQGYIILQVTAHNPGGTPSMQTVEPQIEQSMYMQQIEPAVRNYLTRLRIEAYIDIRPSYTDSAASSGETKPTFTAYVPPQPKKKRKKKRFDNRVKQYGRITDHRKAVAVTAASAPVTTGTPAPTPTPAQTASVHRSRFHMATHKKQQSKRVKLRYGQAPAASVSSEQVAASGNTPTASPAATEATAAVASGEVQPLGPDLEHTTAITKPKQHKTRFSDEARNKSARSTTKGGVHHLKIKKVKVDNAKPTELTPAEAADQKVESAPLGLSGDTVHKKKKKKVKVKNGEKTRLSDEKKTDESKDRSPETGANPTPPQP
jgi:peptidyl-prolyl cis-trans isomerase SurA